MNPRLKFLLILVVGILVLVSFQLSIVRTSTTYKGPSPVIGWIEGNCFAVAKDDVDKEVYIFVVSFDGQQNMVEAQVIGPATGQNCTPLAPGRGQRNRSAGLSFYEIKPSVTIERGIGVLGKIGRRKLKRGAAHADIDGDRKAEQFSVCATDKGLRYNVWSSTPYRKAPVWTGFNYLGRDIEPTCPQ